MNLSTAQRYADQIAEWLTPFCVRLEIVGSIRRRRPICNDVDIVCIPKTSSEERVIDMFTREMVIVSHLRQFLNGYIAAPSNGASWLGRAPTGRNKSAQGNALGITPATDPSPEGASQAGPEPKPDAINLLLQLKKCQLDIFCATETTWATLKLCRTGSREHNIWLAQRAQDRGGHWNPYKGLSLPSSSSSSSSSSSHFLSATTEEDMYTALKLPFIEPQNRELHYLQNL